MGVRLPAAQLPQLAGRVQPVLAPAVVHRAGRAVRQPVGERAAARVRVPAHRADRPGQRARGRRQQRVVHVQGDRRPGTRGQLVLQRARRGQLHGPHGREPHVARGRGRHRWSHVDRAHCVQRVGRGGRRVHVRGDQLARPRVRERVARAARGRGGHDAQQVAVRVPGDGVRGRGRGHAAVRRRARVLRVPRAQVVPRPPRRQGHVQGQREL